MATHSPETTFYRPVRNYPEPLPQEAFQLQPPPQMPQKQGGAAALLQFLYPLSGVLMTVVMVVTTTSGGGKPNLLVIIAESAIIPLSVGVMFFSTFIQRRAGKQAYKAEKQTYKGYLENVQRRLNEIVKQQSLYSAWLYPDPQRLPALVEQRQVLWERRPADEDFLWTRLGLAPTALCCQVSFQEDFKARYTLDLLQEARDLVTRYSHVDAQPLIIPLGQLGTVSITGPRPAVTALVRAMLAEIITFHAASEVRIIGYFPTHATLEWSWLKWTPHTRRLRLVKTLQAGDPELYSMLADSIEELQLILETQIGPELEQRHKLNEERKSRGPDQGQVRRPVPHLLLILDNYSHSGPLARVPGLEELMRDGASMGITVLCLCPTQEQEPSLTRARLSLAPFIGGYQLSYKETVLGGRELEFVQPDNLDVQHCEEIARSLTPLQLIDREAEIDFSQNVSLLELYAIPALENFDVRQLWQKIDEKQLLRVPIGIQKGGPLLLDLKEMAMGGYGPHGLVVGATGSGKSELLRTVVTSLALTHDPYVLNFVLVDFKAGAAFADFEGLPHLAGMITNLENDPQLISRMYASLLGEQQRRQNMLSQAGNLANIRQYQAKWRKNPDMEPMPYLLIIVDEFAQLIATYEDFLALFVKFGQVGRSLGMHMMLATQRIDEGRIRTLEGHLRYRIGLRTFKPDESTAVIGRPDAYYLPPSPGSGYFKVDEDIYTGFKTALISIPYVPPEKKQVNPLDLICEFTPTGQLVPCQTPLAPVEAEDEDLVEHTEMNVVVERIARVPQSLSGWRVHAVWQPPLGEKVPLDLVLKKCGIGTLDGSHWLPQFPLGQLCVPIGMMDRPTEQTQVPLILDFSGAGGHLAIVGAPQTGKSMLLRTLLTSLIVTHTPRDVQIYGIDFGGGLLRVFEGAPHVGAICSRSARDKMRRVLRRLKEVLTEREAFFVAREIDSMAVYRQQRQQGRLNDQEFGDVFLVVDNFGQLQTDFEMSDQDIISDIVHLIANGLTYGVHVVLATNLWSEIRPRLRANMGSRLELRLNDPSDSEIDRKLAVTLPASAPGRGLHPSKLVFQAALPIVRDEEIVSDFSVQQALEELVARASKSWRGPVAPPIRVLPPEVLWSDLPLPSGDEQPGVPLGLEELRLSPFYLDLTREDAHLLILGDRECGKTTLLRTWLRGLAQRYTPEQAKIVLFDYRRTLIDFHRSEHLLAYVVTPDQAREAITLLKTEMEKRLAASMAPDVSLTGQSQTWSGLRYYVVVDDYESVATPSPQTGNPLNPLEGFLTSGLEIGLHLILARRVTELGRINFDSIFRGVKNMEAPGFLMRGDPVEGRQALHKQNIPGDLPTGRARYVTRNTAPTLIQIARTDP
ncbi:MAG TPA: type VII secretion protein EccCa [Ktedonobacteraceae bacterium]|nr:type VII secretion protein EccCa [Ktedonobacteraceae bacterium]